MSTTFSFLDFSVCIYIRRYLYRERCFYINKVSPINTTVVFSTSYSIMEFFIVLNTCPHTYFSVDASYCIVQIYNNLFPCGSPTEENVHAFICIKLGR